MSEPPRKKQKKEKGKKKTRRTKRTKEVQIVYQNQTKIKIVAKINH